MVMGIVGMFEQVREGLDSVISGAPEIAKRAATIKNTWLFSLKKSNLGPKAKPLNLIPWELKLSGLRLGLSQRAG